MNSKIKILFILAVVSLVSFMLGKNITFIIKNLGFASQGDFDSDGIPDSIDKYPFDYDNDGMPDIWEKRNGLRYDADDASEDYDHDDTSNIDEYRQGTNPWVSDKTGERVAQVVSFSPIEKRIVKSSVWIGAAIFVFSVIALILFRKNILRIFWFMYHVSKEYFEKKKAPFRPVPRGRPVFYQRNYPRYRTIQQRRFIQPAQRRPMTRTPIAPARTGIQPMERLPERNLEERYVLKPKEAVIKETERKPDVIVPSEEKASPIKKEPFEGVADFVKEEKHDNVFERIRKISSRIEVK